MVNDNSEIIILMAHEIVNDIDFKIDLSQEMNSFKYEIIDISYELKVFSNFPPKLQEQINKLKYLKSKHDLFGDGYLIFRIWFVQKEKEESTFLLQNQ